MLTNIILVLKRSLLKFTLCLNGYTMAKLPNFILYILNLYNMLIKNKNNNKSNRLNTRHSISGSQKQFTYRFLPKIRHIKQRHTNKMLLMPLWNLSVNWLYMQKVWSNPSSDYTVQASHLYFGMPQPRIPHYYQPSDDFQLYSIEADSGSGGRAQVFYLHVYKSAQVEQITLDKLIAEMRRTILTVDPLCDIKFGRFVLLSFSKKPDASRMGKGKGEPHHFVYMLHPDRYVFKFANMDLQSAKMLAVLFTKRTNCDAVIMQY